MEEKKKIQLASHKYFPDLIELWRIDQLGKLVNHDGKIISGQPTSYEEGLKLLRNIHSKKKLVEKIVEGKFIMDELKIGSGPSVGRLKNDLKLKIILGEIKNLADAKKYLRNL